jgi:hypothetical protein
VPSRYGACRARRTQRGRRRPHAGSGSHRAIAGTTTVALQDELLGDHDAVVDQEPEDERQSPKRDEVEGKTERDHQRRRHRQGYPDREEHDPNGPDAAEHRQQHENDEQKPHSAPPAQVAQLLPHAGALVRGHLQARLRRHRLLDRGDLAADAARRLDHVAAGRTVERQGHHRIAVDAGDGPAGRGRELDVGHLLQRDGRGSFLASGYDHLA